MQRPMFYPFIALAAGVLIGDFIAAPRLWLLFGLLLALFSLLICVRRKLPFGAFFFVLLFLLTVGIFSMQIPKYSIENPQHIVHQANRELRTVEGIVLSSQILSSGRQTLVVDCQRLLKNKSPALATGKIRLNIPGALSFQYGDFIRFHTSINKLTSFHNPGNFQYERYLNRQGIYVSGFVANGAGIVLLRRQTANPARQKLEMLRSYFKQILEKNAPSPEKEILEAMTLGNQKGIPQAVLDDFAKTGVSHILSISGLHISMVAAGSFFLALLILKRSEYLMLQFNIAKIAATAAFAPVILYALIAGMGTTVMRSALMALALLAALLIARKKESYNILFTAALIILIVAPEALFEISFQLSFSAVFAILYIVPKYSHLPLPTFLSKPSLVQSSARGVYLFLLVSASATLGGLPIVAYYFNHISAISLVANLIAVPLLGMLTLFLAMLFLFTSFFFPALGGLFVKAASFCTYLSLKAINWLAAFSWSSFSVIKPNLLEIILIYVLIFGLLSVFALNRKQTDFSMRHPVLIKSFLLAACALLLAENACFVFKDKYADSLRITALDVGQGSSTLVQFPQGINMLIDGGGSFDSSFDMGRLVVAPFLYAKRIRKIDVVLLTHPHPDHLQGLLYIINNFPIGEIWHSGRSSDDELYRLWEKTIKERKIKTKILSAQSPEENIAKVQIQVFWPLRPPSPGKPEASYEETNDSSLVLKMTHGKSSFLVTGDISKSVETALVNSGRSIKSTLLFAPHHGSVHSNSLDFIRAVSCSHVIISAGKNNVFRHPHPIVIKRYQSANAHIFRTDQDGAIFVLADEKTIRVTPWARTMHQ